MTLKPQSTAEMLAGSLRKMINNGSLPDGSRLVERDLASQFAVSRVPMREAIRLLEQEGMVDIFRNRGAVVRTLSVEDIAEIYELRALLEGEAIFNSVQNMDAETLARAELTHTLLGNAEDVDRQGELNREFHGLLYRGCQNKRLLAMIDELRNQIERYEHFQHRLLSATQAFQHEHELILNACREGNAEAAWQETFRHIESAGRVLKDFISKGISAQK